MTQATSTARTQPATTVAMIAAMALGIGAGTAMRLAFSPVQELAKAELHLSDVQLSLVQGLAAALSIALLSLPLGRLTDRTNRLRIVGALTLASALGSAATALVETFTGLFVARMVAGISGFCLMPVAISLAADVTRPELRGRALLFMQIGQMAGAGGAFALAGGLVGALPPVDLPLLGVASGWRQVHLLFAAIGLAALLPLFLLREPARREVASAVDLPLRAALAALWTRRRFIVPLYLGQLTVVMADSAASIWAAPVLTRDYGLRPADFAGWMGLVLLLSGVIGAAIGGVVADLGERKGLPGGMLAGAVAAALVAIPAAFFPVMPGPAGFGWALGLLLVCGSVTGLVTATALAVHIPNELRGLCLALFVVIGAIGGLGLAPTLVPLIAAPLGGEQATGLALAILTASTSVIALIGFLGAIRHTPRGIEA